MAKKLNDSIKAKLGNCFEVVNEEKKEGAPNIVKWQKDTYILVHVKHSDNDEMIQWLLTEKEFRTLISVSMTRALSKYLDKGKLYAVRIGNHYRYIVKVQDLDKSEIIIAVSLSKADTFKERACYHPKSIVKLKKSLFDIF